MLKLDDKDLVSIAGGRALRSKRWYIGCGVGLVLIVLAYAYTIFSHSPSLVVLRVWMGLFVLWAVGAWTVAWIHKRRILKKLREEYSEIIES